MLRMRFIVLSLLLALPAYADEVSDSRALQQEALAAYRAGDAALFLNKIAAASALRPQHPTILWQLAVAQAMNGRRDEAFASIERVARFGFVYKMDDEQEFAALRDDPRYAVIAARFVENAKPRGRATVAFTFDEPSPEGLAYDGKRFYVGGVKSNRVLAVDARAARELRKTPYGVYGMAFARGTLWIATSNTKESALLGGRRELRLADGQNHHFGDLTVAPNGDVYVSDGAMNAILRVEHDALVPFAHGPFSSLQGLAVDGNTLFASDYTKGIFAIDLRTRDAVALRAPDDASLLGIDGIYLAAPHTLIAVQNGTNPQRIVRLHIAGTRIDRVETLLANDPRVHDLTLGAIANGAFYVNDSGQILRVALR